MICYVYIFVPQLVCLGLHSSREISDVGVFVESGVAFFGGFIMPRGSRYIEDFAISIGSGVAPYQWDEALLDLANK